MIEIRPFSPDLAVSAADSYAQAFGATPFCPPIAPTLLTDPAHLPCDNLPWLRDDLILVGLADGRVVGYVHVAAEDAKPEAERSWDDYAQPQGVLRMFWYERGQRAVGEALLARAEAHLRALSLPRVEVMHSKRGYLWHHLPHAHLTQRTEHLHGLLLADGYARDKSNVALSWRDACQAPLAPCDLKFSLRRELEDCPGPLPRVLLFAEQGETFLGMCVGGSLAEQHPEPAAREWLYIRWLTTSPEARGHGLAKRLLTEMFRDWAARGARHAAICCIEENTPALLLYANLGFGAVDFSYTQVKTLD